MVETINTLGWQNNQKEFAASLDISRTTIIGYVKGTSAPSAEFLTKLNEIYNVSVDWILTGKGNNFLSATIETNPIARENGAINEYKEAFERHFQELGNT